MNLIQQLSAAFTQNQFSGTVLVRDNHEVLAELSHGYANRSEQIKNENVTRYGIASGCKIFTAIAICQLVEDGKLSMDAKLSDCLEFPLLNFDGEITIHHLLTHTSGVPDYFDEDVMDDFEALWVKNPMYQLRTLADFLPLFQEQPMKFTTGERFHYNNAGYILLGLIVEQASGLNFTDYVQKYIFQRAGMNDSGYFEMDTLPPKIALGYIDMPGGKWKTNIYSLPVKGGSDGGAYVTAHDMARVWEALIGNRLLSEEYTQKLLTPHIKTNDNYQFYGYGVWIDKNENEIFKYHLMGYDPGVSFHSAYYPKSAVTVVVCSNQSEGAYEIMKAIEDELK